MKTHRCVWANPRWCDRCSGRPAGGCGWGQAENPVCSFGTRSQGRFRQAVLGCAPAPRGHCALSGPSCTRCPNRCDSILTPPSPGARGSLPQRCAPAPCLGSTQSCLEPRIWASPPGHSPPVSVSIREPHLRYLWARPSTETHLGGGLAPAHTGPCAHSLPPHPRLGI